MKFLLDENVDSRLAPYLAGPGHDVKAIAQDFPHALSDQEVLSIAHREGRILITNDRDYGDLIFRHLLPHSGVILFRLRTTRLETKQQRLDYVLARYSDRLHNFIVVSEQRVRIRRAS